MSETKLILEDGAGRILDELVLGRRPITIGRDPHCGVRLPSPFVSKRHAAIRPSGKATDRWSVTPLGLNGTRLNQRLIREGEEHSVGAGDVIEVPGFLLRLENPDARRSGDRYQLK